MPTFERGDMWDMFGKTDLFLITTNPVVNKQGLAVMGRGAAKQAADKFPTIRKDFAQRMHLLMSVRLWPCYSDIIDEYAGQEIGFFMVKSHWARAADPKIIAKSVEELCDWLMDEPRNRVDLNFPGIGNGKLSREDVLPLLAPLPDNVHIWEYD